MTILYTSANIVWSTSPRLLRDFNNQAVTREIFTLIKIKVIMDHHKPNQGNNIGESQHKYFENFFPRDAKLPKRPEQKLSEPRAKKGTVTLLKYCETLFQKTTSR